MASTPALPSHPSHVTPEWLTEALRERFPSANVASIEVLDVHEGTNSNARLLVGYDAPCELPETFFLKIAPRGIAQRIFGHAFGLGETEVRFYRELALALPVRAPRAYAARASRDAARFALLLEDLSPPGARFVEVADDVGRERLEAVAIALRDGDDGHVGGEAGAHACQRVLQHDASAGGDA